MKRLVTMAVLVALILTGTSIAANQKVSTARVSTTIGLKNLLQDWFEGFDDEWFRFYPTTTAPSAEIAGHREG